MKKDLFKVGNNHWTEEDLLMLWSNKFMLFFNRNNVIYELLIIGTRGFTLHWLTKIQKNTPTTSMPLIPIYMINYKTIS